MDYVRKNNVTHQVGTKLPSTYPSSRVTYGNNSNVEEQLNALNPSILWMSQIKNPNVTFTYIGGCAVKIGNIVILNFYGEWSSLAANTIIATLPVGWRPASTSSGTGSLTNSSNTTTVRRSQINSSGEVNFSSTLACTNFCGTIIYQVA